VILAWSYLLARFRLRSHGTRAQRQTARQRDDATLVALWMAANPQGPLQAAGFEIPLSGRRLRQALARLADEATEAGR
jgi:hypothetical protein